MLEKLRKINGSLLKLDNYIEKGDFLSKPIALLFICAQSCGKEYFGSQYCAGAFPTST